MVTVQGEETSFEFTRESMQEGLQELQAMLSRGTPVAVINHRWKTIKGLPGFAQPPLSFVFLSDGEMQEKKFGVLKGKYDTMCARLEGEDLDNYILDTVHEKSISVTIMGAFQATSCILVGERVQEEFGTIVQGVEFAQEAYCFELDDAYTRLSDYINMGDEYAPSGSRRATPLESVVIAGAARRLISDEWKILKPDDLSGIVGTKAWKFKKRHLIDEAHMDPRVDDEDFVIYRYSAPCDAIAYVKTSRSTNVGRAYILRANDLGSRLIERAFSTENIQRYFPFESENIDE